MARIATLAAVAAAGAFLLAGPARGAEFPPELDGLVKEGKLWFQKAGNPDLETKERSEARVNAWKNLWRAQEILNKHGDDHPGDLEKIDARFGDVGSMVYWIKKESPMGLLETSGVGPWKDEPESSGGTNAEGRAKQSDWPDRPPPEREGEAPPGRPAPPPPPGGAPGTPTPAPAAAPVAPSPPPMEEAFKEAEAYARKHRADHPGVRDRFLDLMTRYPDSSHPLFQKAARLKGEAEGKMKDVYRTMRDSDPDSIKGATDAREKNLVVVLAQDLGSRDSAVRERAARLLGDIGAGEGAYALAKALRGEAEPQAALAMGDSLVRIGGCKAGEQLGKLSEDKKIAGTGVDLLVRFAARNAVDRRLAALQMARFVDSPDKVAAKKALDTLIGMGGDGALGLRDALGATNDPDERIRIFHALADTKQPWVAGPLSKFLIAGDVPNAIRCRDEAMKALRAMNGTCGEAIVPYMFEGLRGSSTKGWTASLLREVTGQSFGMSRPGDWVSWWKQKHPDWKPDVPR